MDKATMDAVWTVLGDTGTPDDYATAKAMRLAPVPHYRVREAVTYLRKHHADVISPLANNRQTALAVLHAMKVNA